MLDISLHVALPDGATLPDFMDWLMPLLAARYPGAQAAASETAPDPLVHELAATLKAVALGHDFYKGPYCLWNCDGGFFSPGGGYSHAADCPRQLALARYAAEYPEPEAAETPRPAVSATFTVPEGGTAAALLLALAEFAEAQGVVDFALSPDPEGSHGETA